MWDRGDGLGSLWGWRLSRRWAGRGWPDNKGLSSSEPRTASVQDPRKPDQQAVDPWDKWNKQWHQDYESFKAAVDKAGDRDPYGTLFGRHLRSPLSAKNSGWTAWSWVFETRASLEPGHENENASNKNFETTETSERADKSPVSQPTFSVPPRISKEQRDHIHSPFGEDYRIDPITMRKIPRAETSAPPTPEKKPLLSTLFSEHGAVDIPVKTYKPHKVYGYGPSNQTKTDSKEQTFEGSATPKKVLAQENSRLRELQNLKACTLGTSIDTTAEYGGKYVPREDTSFVMEVKSASEPMQQRQLDSETEDNVPLFSGTTYQSKADRLVAPQSSSKDWLQREGFQTVDEALTSNSKSSLTTQEASPERMETALDRHTGRTASFGRVNSKQLEASYTRNAQRQAEEDTDLLRASDVRAAARTARSTKQQAEQAKREVRRKLERDFEYRQKSVKGEELSQEQEAKWARNVKTAWKHISEYPQGVVAKTMQSLGLYNSNFKNYVRLDKPPVDLTGKLVFKDELLSKVASIHKKRPMALSKKIDTFTPSLEVIKADEESRARRATLRKATEETQKREVELQAFANDIATDIRAAYESQYGRIDVNHRQISPAMTNTGASVQQTTVAEDVKKPHPLLAATSRPGTELEPAIQNYTRTFEPRLAELKDEARSIRRTLHEISLQMKALKSQRPQTYWNADTTPLRVSDGEAAKRATSTRIDEPAKITDKITRPPNAVDLNPVTRIAGTLMQHDKPMFLFLAYNPETGAVDASPLSIKVFRKQDSEYIRDETGSMLLRLNQPSKYMQYFAPLEAAGYELYKGGRDSLIFKRVAKQGLTPAEQANLTEQKNLQSGPVEDSPVILQLGKDPKQAAKVLDDIPDEAGPQPGPAAPTAPMPNSSNRVMRRQEEVFSGQSISKKTPSDAGPTIGVADDLVQSISDASSKTTTQSQSAGIDQSESIWRRFSRSVRRVVLTGVAMAGFAYTIGVVAEGVGAQPAQRRIPSSEEWRSRGTRPGIYSTESSRW